MVTIDLITGFLGSGKTTFLKKYAEYLMDQGLHIGILENDFGAINVDMLMLHELRGDQCELEMIAGGCDAESHRRRFRTKLISMRMCGYDRVLVEAGNTVVVIEHNLDVIKTADHIVDLGPEGGDGGGTIVAQGTPEEVAEVPASFTGQYLKPVLDRKSVV